MRLLHVVAPAGVGGLERVVQTLAVAQHAQGHDVHVAVVGGLAAADATQFEAPFRDQGVALHIVDLPGRAYLRERAAIAALARDLATEVVHTHGYRPDVIDGTVARRSLAVAVTTVHGFTGGDLRNRVYEWMQRRAFRRFDAVVAVSRPLRDSLRASGVAAERLHLLMNAWRPFSLPLDRTEARRRLGLSKDGFTIGWVGRVSHEKGLDVFLETLPELAKAGVRAAVIGDGDQRAALAARFDNLRDSGALTWCGNVVDAARYFAAFDAFVLSSRTEGTPMVLYEAMSARVPVVATRVGGVPDVVSDAEANLVSSENPEALIQALRDVIARPVAARERAESAHTRLGRIADVSHWCRSYTAIYHAAVNRRPVA